MSFALYCGVSSQSTIVANSFVVLHAWALHLSTVGGHEDAFAGYFPICIIIIPGE